MKSDLAGKTKQEVGIAFYVQYVVGGLFAFLASFALVFVFFSVVGGPEGLGIPFDIGFPAALGLCTAAMSAVQTMSLRPFSGNMGLWIPVSGLSMAVIFALVDILLPKGYGLSGKAIEGLTHGTVIGLSLGFAQYKVLKTRIQGAGRWIPASIVCWSIAVTVGDVVGVALGGPLDFVAAFGLYGVLSGLAMYLLLADDQASSNINKR